ncbi:MAG TPA: peptidoglycan-binding protein [Patescibacteria group bacterium]|nr:peptidoglycan-binding protein [Patescibacteria group bacterium]
MARKLVALFALVSVVGMLSGCATARKQKDLEVQGLRNQISVMETQLQSKDEEINGLKDELNKANTVAQAKVADQQAVAEKVVPEVKSRPTMKHVQIALKNAGYDPGPIDGKGGKQTRNAIKAFQKDNGLHVDGKAGKRTWNALQKYLYQKVK